MSQLLASSSAGMRERPLSHFEQMLPVALKLSCPCEPGPGLVAPHVTGIVSLAVGQGGA